jgi:hypothetical protein
MAALQLKGRDLWTKMRAYARSLLLAVLLVAWTVGSVAAVAALASAVELGTLAIHLLALVFGAPAAVGGLVLCWSVADIADFRRRGYRIRHLAREGGTPWALGPTHWAYEELAPDGGHRTLRFVRVILAAGYPCTSEVLLPDEDTWDAEMPAWAHGRRHEIVARLLDLAGPAVTRIGRAG